MKRAAIIFAGALVSAANAAVIIDDFSVPYSKSITSGSNVDYQSGAFLGGLGERDVEMRVWSNPLGQSMDLTITGRQLAIVSNGFSLRSKLTLQYDNDGDEAGNTGANHLLNTSAFGASHFAGNDTIQVRMLGNDLPINVKMTLRDGAGGVISQIVQSKLGGGAGNVNFNAGAAAMLAARSLTLEFEAETSGDFAIEEIAAVPEPATMAALGLGAAAMLRRRRK